jgi:hypothetical protein
MNMKQFTIAITFFAILALGAIAGITFALGKYLVPPAGFDALVTRYLGERGPLLVVVICYLLGVGLAYLLTRKFVIPRLGSKPS